MSEAQRKFMGTLWNTYAFYVLYADIDRFDPTEHRLVRENLTEMDRFLLSRLNTLVKTVDADLAAAHHRGRARPAAVRGRAVPTGTCAAAANAIGART